jgi:hypothetical protein
LKSAHLAVDVLETAHDDSVEVLDLFSALDLLEENLSLDNRLIDDLLVLETVDVLSSMGVEVLEGLRELVIEAVDESHDRATNDDDGLFSRGGSLDLVIVIGGGLANGEGGFGKEGIEEGIEEFLGGRPGFERHVSVGRGVVIELSRDEGEDDSDLLVGGSGDAEETFESRDLSVAVGVLERPCKSNVSNSVVTGEKVTRLTLRPRCSMTWARAL